MIYPHEVSAIEATLEAGNEWKAYCTRSKAKIIFRTTENGCCAWSIEKWHNVRSGAEPTVALAIKAVNVVCAPKGNV